MAIFFRDVVERISSLAILGLLSASSPAIATPLTSNGLVDEWGYSPTGQSNSGYAGEVTGIGDFNGDGVPDFAVAAGGWVRCTNCQRQGAVFIYLGDGTFALGTSPDYVLYDDLPLNAPGTGFGTHVGGGDFDNDGYSDVVVSAIYDKGTGSGTTQVGAIHVFYGRVGVPGANTIITPNWRYTGFSDYYPTGVATGANTGLYYGWGLATNVDTNCDGFKDIVVSTAYAHSSTTPYLGQVDVFYGSGTRFSGTHNPDWHQNGPEYLIEFGWGLSAIGNFNGDTRQVGEATYECEDVVVGAPRTGYYNLYRGSTFILRGAYPNPVLGSRFDFTAQNGARYGEYLGAPGDVNGDGYDDFLVGSPVYDESGYTDTGRVWLVTGNSSGTNSMGSAVASPVFQASSNFGRAVGGTGRVPLGPTMSETDLNGDGCADFAIGQNRYDNSSLLDEGRMWVYLGCQSETDLTQADYWIEGDVWTGDMAVSISSTGDLDGDGHNELLAGAASYDLPNSFNNGRVWVIDLP